MTSIRAFSEILREAESLDDAAQEKYAGIIHDEALRLTRLLDDLLDLSVLENGEVSLNTQSGPLRPVIEKAVRTAKAAYDNPIDIVVLPDRLATLVYTDRDRLGQVFLNLITNAQKYCDAETPRLTIWVEMHGDGLAIVFEDNGTGIDPARASMIFEKFVRIEQPKVSGAGLGLAICREIMTRLSGDVTHESSELGNRFTVWLKDAQANAAE